MLFIRLILIFCIVLLLPFSAGAQIGNFDSSLSQLQLSPQQKQKVQQTKQNTQVQMRALKEKIQSKQNKLNSALKTDETADEEIIKLRKEIDSLDEKMNRLKSQSRRQIINVLTEKQQDKLRELQFGK